MSQATLNFRIEFCHSTGIARSRAVGSGPAQQAMLREGSDTANTPNQTFELNPSSTFKLIRCCVNIDVNVVTR